MVLFIFFHVLWDFNDAFDGIDLRIDTFFSRAYKYMLHVTRLTYVT